MTIAGIMRQNIGEIAEVLKANNVPKADRKRVYEAYKNICYCWAETNAVAYVFDENVRRENPDLFMECGKPAKNMARVMAHLYKTYPKEWIEEDDDED